MTDLNVIENALMKGDLAQLKPDERLSYYKAMCESLGLNPLTRPFDYINLNGKLTLYAKKDATDQLRKKHDISIGKPDIRFEDDWIIVTVEAHDKSGRIDSDIGVVSKKDMRGDFGNALMKAVTKAKRRVTLSICGLGMLDETEIETIPDARPVVVTDHGEIVEHAQPQPSAPAPAHPKPNGGSFNPVQFLIDEGISKDGYAASKLLSHKGTPNDVKMDPDKLRIFGKLYRVWKDAGTPTEQAIENAANKVPFED